MQHIPLHPHPVLVILHVTTVTCIVFKNTEHNVTVRVIRHVTNKKSQSCSGLQYKNWSKCDWVLKQLNTSGDVFLYFLIVIYFDSEMFEVWR